MKFLALFLVLASSLTAAAPRPKILGVAHIALFVHDLDQARGFYKDLLGYAEPFHLSNPDGAISLTFIKINDRQYIELFPEKAPQTDRLHHISLEVDDAEAMRLYLASQGVKVPAAVSRGRIGNANFMIQDPDGHSIEIVQYLPAGWSLREKGNHLPASRIAPRMSHVGITIGALEPALAFYRDLLGFTETWRGSRDGKVLDWVNLRVPDGEDYIEFMLYGEKPALNRLGTLHHLCLEVADLPQALARLEKNPARARYTRPLEIRTGINRKRQMNLYDPDGTRSELMEPTTIDGVPTPSSPARPPR
jgi:lactoylglutathione lyase